MVYLDYNATTPVDPRVAEAMWPYLRELFGNPSSVHAYGVNAKSEYRTDRRPYREVYTQEQAYRVATIFAEERRLHGYAF